MTVAELIDALGGSRVVAEIIGVECNAVGNWRKRGIPAWALSALSRICAENRVDPGDALEPRRPRIAA